MSKSQFFKNEQGNVALVVAIGAAGVSLMLGYAKLDQVNQKTNNAKRDNEKHFLSTRNTDAFQTATSLLNSGDVSKNRPAALYPIKYVPDDFNCERARNLNPIENDLYKSSGVNITLKLASMHLDNSTVFDATKTGSTSKVTDAQVTNMTILGFKCSSDPSKPFLIESAYVQSSTKLDNVSESRMVAEIPMSLPPRSGCDISLLDPVTRASQTIVLNDAPASITMAANSLALTVQCNQVVTKLKITNQLSEIGGVPTAPTKANTVSNVKKEMLDAAITLSPGSHDIRVYATQPDGYDIVYNLKLTQDSTKPPSYCSHKCITVPGGVTRRSTFQHSPCYEARNSCGWGWYPQAETGWICYHPRLRTPQGRKAVMYVFDPADECAGQLVAERNQDFAGCFTGDTLISMHDGSHKRADAVRKGDLVFNPILKSPIRVKKVISGPEIAALVEVGVQDRRVTVSSKHTFMTSIGAVSIENLAVGDKVLDYDGSYQPIVSKNVIENEQVVTVYNYVLEGDDRPVSHLIVGNGIPSGDIILQNAPVDPNIYRYAFEDR
ncbi:MAG: Hint domain-containing protein [Oligoflexus sp.]